MPEQAQVRVNGYTLHETPSGNVEVYDLAGNLLVVFERADLPDIQDYLARAWNRVTRIPGR